MSLNHVGRTPVCLVAAGSATAAAAGQHEFVDKVDNGAGWLVRVQLGEHVALIATRLGWPPGHKGEQTRRRRQVAVRCGSFLEAPASVLRVEAAVGYLGGGEVFPEEEAARLVGQRDALT